MREKTVILETNSKSKKRNIPWQPIRNGKTFQKYLNLNNKLEEIDRKNLDDCNLIGQTINPSIPDKVGMNSTGLCLVKFKVVKQPLWKQLVLWPMTISSK